MRPEDIIIKPIITEESNAGIQEGKYILKNMGLIFNLTQR